MVPINKKPLLQHIIEKLIKSGFNEIIVNIHHFPDQIIDFLKENNNFGIRIEVSDERDELLDTGGGIRKADSVVRQHRYRSIGREPLRSTNNDVLML